MEEASKAKKAKKGFMTPERKKKLRVSSIRWYRKIHEVIKTNLPSNNSCCCVKKPLRN
jgi:hypothetical protein